MKTGLKYKIVKSRRQYNNYCKQLETLISKNRKSDIDEIELLTLLIEKYDNEQYEMPAMNPIQLLKSLMTEHSLKAKDLTEILDLTKGTVSKILNYQKGLSKETIRILHCFWLRQATPLTSHTLNHQLKNAAIMSRFFRVALLLILTLNLRAQVEEEVVLKTATGNIAGSLLLPDLEKISPLVLIIAGSGPTDRNGNNPMMTNNSLKMLAKGLQSKGIASIRYDKRGIGESQSAGPIESDLRFEHYIKDAEDWITLLRKDERFSEVIVLGHSEGSLIGMIASQTSEVDKFISVAGTGFPAGEIIRNQLKEQPEFILNQSLPIIEKLEKGELEENVPPMLASLFRKSVQPYLISWFKYAY